MIKFLKNKKNLIWLKFWNQKYLKKVFITYQKKIYEFESLEELVGLVQESFFWYLKVVISFVYLQSNLLSSFLKFFSSLYQSETRKFSKSVSSWTEEKPEKLNLE